MAQVEPRSRQIKASVLYGPKDLRIEPQTLPPPPPSHLQIHPISTGICGSDLHYYHHYRNGDIQVLEPLSMGHESSGVVTAIGEGVEGFEVGDLVALEVGLPCGDCDRCREGRYNICKDMRFRSSAKGGLPHAQGTLREGLNLGVRWCHRLPPSISPTLGALLEPLSVAIHSNRRASLPPSSTVLVFGAGTVGLLVSAIAKIQGARSVIIADIDQGRVDFAVANKFAQLGFVVPRKRGDRTIDEQLTIAREIATEIGCVKKPGGKEEKIGEVDAVFECTGQPSCLQTAIYATRPGGKIMLIGMGTPIQTLPISAASLKEVDLIGVFRYANTYPEGIDVLRRMMELHERDDGDTEKKEYPKFDKVVTHRFKGLENVPQAFDMAARTMDEDGNLVIKVVVEMNAQKPGVSTIGREQ